MSARGEIRAITFSNLAVDKDFSRRKWIHPSDEVFNKLGELVDYAKQVKIADFLNLFYYFIICYSKKCFKKHGIWQPSRYKHITNECIQFNYDLANETDAHSKILEIQTRMNRYRQEYKAIINRGLIYHTDFKIRELMNFIDESLEAICTDIQEPVKFTSYDIKCKMAKYTPPHEFEAKQDGTLHKKHKKSQKLNYAVLEQLGL